MFLCFFIIPHPHPFHPGPGLLAAPPTIPPANPGPTELSLARDGVLNQPGYENVTVRTK